MSIQVIYSCGTCGLSIVDRKPYHKDHPNTVVGDIVWHECSDGYVVPLQSKVEKANEPVQKKDS